MTRIFTIAAALAVVLASIGILAKPAAAHDRRTVGPYTFVVGWSNEPAHVGLLNGLDLTITDTATGKGVEGLEKTLKAEIISGGNAATLLLTLEARFGQPGKYRGEVVPTKTGDYTFHISGLVGTTAVNERFESGPGRFEGVDELRSLEFPTADPSGSEISARLDDVSTKLTIAISLAGLALVVSLGSLALRKR